MDQNCALSCAKLEYARQRYYKRCPKPEKYEPALAPGQMSSTFERIMTDFPELEPEWISRDPPVILFHNFLSVEESDAFISHGSGRYAKSLGVTMKEDGTMGDAPTEIRTSSHGWCQHPECLNDPLVQNVVTRVSNITQTPSTNAEYAQLVYYHACPTPDDPKCAFYKRHNDFIDGDEHKLQGVRIYTLFTYLNDVPEGGGTRFTDLPNGPVTFEPKRGKAVLWPSVLEDQPHSKDDRTHHEALPVTKGEKFGANFWIHQYDFKGAHAKGCTASLEKTGTDRRLPMHAGPARRTAQQHRACRCVCENTLYTRVPCVPPLWTVHCGVWLIAGTSVKVNATAVGVLCRAVVRVSRERVSFVRF